MRLPINIEELLSGRAVEGDRIEYKTGWNPDAIYRTICAFANDFDETGGGYIVVGVKEENGHAIRPVTGIDPNQIEPIEKDMVGFNNLIRPYYQPRLYIEVADGKTILVIKVSPGERRPYKVPDQITAKQKTYNYYIRYNSSSIIPKDEYERGIKNVAAMMFSERPDRFFRQAQIDIVLFPEGREKNPNNLIEVEPIRGSVPQMIEKTLSYLNTNIVKKQIIKPKDRAQSITFFNYPYQALEEAVVNSLYHRDYTIREPVEITVEPERISILSFSGPNHTIPMEAVQKGISLRSRRYRNRRLGEFLKELDLTEGRATGIPTIQDELQANGSPAAKIETDEERTYFLIDIPCHPYFINKESTTDLNVVTDGNVTKDDVKDGVKGGVKELTEVQEVIVKEMLFDPYITTSELAQKTGIKFRTLQRYVSQLQAAGIIIREGGRKEGKWVILNKKE